MTPLIVGSLTRSTACFGRREVGSLLAACLRGLFVRTSGPDVSGVQVIITWLPLSVDKLLCLTKPTAPVGKTAGLSYS